MEDGNRGDCRTSEHWDESGNGMTRAPNNDTWKPLLAVFVLVMSLCSGIAALLVGRTLGMYVALTFVALLVLFGLTSVATRFLMGNKFDASLPHDRDEFDRG